MLVIVKSKAVLVKKISYRKDGVLVSVAKGTEIEVDQDRGIALISNDHVEIQKKDYEVLFPH